MAASKCYKPKYTYLLPNNTYLKTQTTAAAAADSSPPTIDFDESDVWSTATSAAASSHTHSFRRQGQAAKKKAPPPNNAGVSPASSAPINVPDWSKILKGEYRNVNCYNHRGWDDDVDDDVAGAGDWLPPHEFLARTRVASPSVHEGAGRTLKGRDLSRVRNAIWQKTGFQD